MILQGSDPKCQSKTAGRNAQQREILMIAEWQHPGARWWKFDFHTHTPASLDTPAWQKAIGTDDEVTPENWLLRFMSTEVDCVAVTDHNSGEWIDKLKESYQELLSRKPNGFRPLHIFPGVEISVNGGFHLLAIFGPEATSSDIATLLGKVDFDGTRGDSDGVTRKGAAEVIQAILDSGGIPIPAHADSAKGLLRLQTEGKGSAAIDPNTLRQVLEMPGILAMETANRSSPRPKTYTEMKLKWTEVIGSDCHNFRDEYTKKPGSHYTWIKMSRPSLEGLRLALLDGAGISVRRSDEGEFNPFTTPEHFIESIEISEAQVMGRSNPAILHLSPYFNAVIGGRGTGKSTIIHALRLALRRSDELDRLDAKSEAHQTFNQFNRIPKHKNDRGGLRDNTTVRIIFSRDGVRHRITWKYGGMTIGVEEHDGNGWVPSANQDVTPQRFPLRLFSQGQIAALAGERSAPLLEVIDDAAGTISFKKKFTEASNSYFVQRARIRELDQQISHKSSVELELQDVERKIKRFEDSHHAEVLKKYRSIRAKKDAVEKQFESAKDIAKKLDQIEIELLDSKLDEFDFESDSEALKTISDLSSAVAKSKSGVAEVVGILREQIEQIEDSFISSHWQCLAGDAESAYFDLKSNLLEQGIDDPHGYETLVKRRQQLANDIRMIDGIIFERTNLAEKSDAQLKAVWDARRRISDSRRDFLARALDKNPYVRIELTGYGRDPNQIEKELRELLGSQEKYEADIYEAGKDGKTDQGLVADFLRNIPDGNQIETMENRLLSMHDRLVGACHGRSEFGAWFNKFLLNQYERHPEFVDRIRCWFPDDNLRVEYSRKGDGKDFRPIGQASAGQRAAAMLALLLAYGDEPLVLDQPEDDLDNHLTYDLVVRQIRENKQKRQILTVTHNANIVINGDAEMVQALDFNNQCYVKQSGSLQEKVNRPGFHRHLWVMENGLTGGVHEQQAIHR